MAKHTLICRSYVTLANVEHTLTTVGASGALNPATTLFITVKRKLAADMWSKGFSEDKVSVTGAHEALMLGP